MLHWLLGIIMDTFCVSVGSFLLMDIARILKVRGAGKLSKRKFSAANSKVKEIPPEYFEYLSEFEELELQINMLENLPSEAEAMISLLSLNLGSNRFKTLPPSVGTLKRLEKLSLYKNCISDISGIVFSSLQNLKFLNLNQNKLTELPPEVGGLRMLESLSVEYNELSYLPEELSNATSLKELRLGFNRLQFLPIKLGNLTELQILNIPANRLRELPETFANLVGLIDLDVSGNCLTYFPSNFDSLKLRDFHCENNTLITYETVYSYQEPVVFSLKEIAARVLLQELRKRGSLIAKVVYKMPKIYDLLSAAGQCAVCRQYFLHTWLECVRFVDSQEVMGTNTRNGLIPIRAQVCSYKCFNNRTEDLFGVAKL